MSKGIKEDWINTRYQIKNPNPCKDGKTWLRHREFSQASIIDQMLLEGKYSILEIAEELNKNFGAERSIQDRMKRVESHIEHLQDGDSLGNGRGVEPHRLRLKEVGGKWFFDLDD